MAYLDHAATTPMLEEVIAAMSATMTRVGNPSSLHTSGRQARRTVEEAREQLADALGARPSEVIFTSGGTEADNLAVKGIFLARKAAEPSRRRVLVSAVEHHAVLDSADWLVDHEGAELVVLPVDETGTVLPRTLSAAIADDPAGVAVISVMWANNEVGTVQPIAELAAIAREHGIPFHTDAVQAAGVLPVSFAESGVDAMTVTGHKLGGPYGTGALLLGRAVACSPVLHGGGQERDVRSGTIDTPGVVGFATATALAVSRRDQTAARLTELRLALLAGIRQVVPDAVLNGHPVRRLPGNLHLSFAGCEGDSLLMLLDARGIECSTGSACSAGVSQPSHVLLAMGADQARARGSLRLSLGHTSTMTDVHAVIEAIGPAVERARRAGMANGAGPSGSSSAPQPADTDVPGPAWSSRIWPDGRDEGAGRDERRGRLGGRRGPRGGCRLGRHRRAPGAVPAARHVADRRPGLLLGGGFPRRPPGRRRTGYPVLRMGFRRALPGRGDRRLRGRVPGRQHPQPVPALQREDQVLRTAGPGARARLRRRGHRPPRPAGRRACCPARWTGPRISPTCWRC